MKPRHSAFAAVAVAGLALGNAGWSFFQEASAEGSLATSALAFVSTLSDSEKQVAVLAYDSPRRVDWHFIPKNDRKGLQIKLMSEQQKAASLKLLRSALSQIGYDKTTQIMSLENLLHELEAGKGVNIRDPQRYFVTLFGKPGTDRWGFSFEGHHLSLNFVMDGDKVISSSPQALCTNPAVVKTDNKSGIAIGTRVLEQEETVAFALINSLSDEQKAKAIIAKKAISEVRNAGVAQPPVEDAVGISFGDLNADQQKHLKKLVGVYCSAMPNKVAAARLDAIDKADWSNVKFAWAGATEEGIGHYYRIQGPSFLVELVNTQPDAAGNLANHVHCVWRDMQGDFALPIASK